jgi:hypothetical protein
MTWYYADAALVSAALAVVAAAGPYGVHDPSRSSSVKPALQERLGRDVLGLLAVLAQAPAEALGGDQDDDDAMLNGATPMLSMPRQCRRRVVGVQRREHEVARSAPP